MICYRRQSPVVLQNAKQLARNLKIKKSKGQFQTVNTTPIGQPNVVTIHQGQIHYLIFSY